MREFLSRLRKGNIQLKLVGDELSVRYPEGTTDPSLLQEIQAKKQELVSYLKTIHRYNYSAIPAIAVQPHYPLSSSQHRLWVLSQFGEGNVAYNIPGTYLFEGALDRSSLEYSLNALMTRHEALRSVFREQEPGQVRQFILPPGEYTFRIDYRDLRGEEEKTKRVKKLVQEEAFIPFNLSRGPLFRAGLYQLEEERWVFSYVMHHIISDGWSMGILIRELLLLYNARIRGEADPLTPLRIHYKDYACWQQEQLGGKILQEHKEYWLRQFDGELPVLSLSGDRPRPAVKRYQGGVVSRSLSPGVVQALKERCRQQGATLFMGLLAAVNALLYKYTGQQDIVTGSPIAGREHTDLEDQIGFYINTLALRLRFSAADSFDELLARSRQVCLEAYGRQAYPFDELIEDLGLRRDMSRNPLFDVVVVLQNAGLSRTGDTRLGALKVSGYEHREQVISKFDLTFNFSETDSEIGSAISSQTDSQMRSKINSELGAGGIQANIEYDSAIFDRSSIVRLAGHLEQLLQALVDAPSVALGRLTYLSAGEQRPLTAAAEAATGYPRDRTIVELFEEQAAKTPDHIAVVWGQEELTYRTLNEKANGLGHYLRSRYAIRADELIGLKLERGPAMIIAMLGVLKSGGAYVPMDPDYPAERIDYMVADSGCKVVLDAAELARAAAQNSGIAQSSDGAAYPKTNLPPVNRSGDLAYVIYTSGTTGHPKGVLIEHRQVVRLFKTEKPLFDFGPADVWTMFHSYCFDFSVWEMYGALLQGGKLILVGPATARDPEAFLELLVSQGVTVLNQTPSYFDTLSRQALERAEALPALRYVIFGGEALHPGRLGAWRQHYPAVRLINMYGITETTVHVTYKEITEREIALALSNIGKPIPTLYAYVLDRDRQLVPVGVPGELYVGGAGVARGYLNRTELTAERFITNPFKEQDPNRFKEQDRLYRSGDQVKWLENGEMEYLGRMDDQVKVRGYRIELAEIQNTLQNLEFITAAAVIARKDQQGNTQLVSYIVGEQELDTHTLRASLARQLPDYMIPSHYVQLKKLPLTRNGKLDKTALPDPDDLAMSTGVEYIAPGNTREAQMAAIWGEIVGKEKIGMRDNFFELGGDSIKVLRMLSELRKQLNLDIPIAFIYRNGTIEDIIAYSVKSETEIGEKKNRLHENERLVREELDGLKRRILSLYNLPDKENIEDIYPMSEIEKGMSFESLLNEGYRIYHDQFIFRQKFFSFDIDRFRQALQLMADKHSILRTCFNLTDYETEVQIVYKTVEIPFYYQDLSSFSREEQDKRVRGYMRSELEIPLIISLAPLWRMSVFNLGNDELNFVSQFHHAILDGWSNASFTTELNNLYLKLGEDASYKPAKLKSDYKDYIVRHKIDQKDQSVKSFWQQELQDCTRLDLFTEEKEYTAYSRAFDAHYFKKLEKTARELNTTVKVLSLTTYLYMLKVLNYDSDLVVGLVTNTRPDFEDSDKMLGCFLNTIPLRIIVDENERGIDFIKRVAARLIELKDKERLSLSEIALATHEKKETGNPFFDVLFSYVDFHVYKDIEKDIADGGEMNSGSDAGFAGGRERTNTLFDCTISATGGGYTINFNLSNKLKAGWPVEKIGELYYNLLTYLIADPYQTIQDSAYLNTAERHELLTTFNDTAAGYPWDKTLVDLFAEQVGSTPDHIAVKFENTRLTYKELDEKSNRLACYLRDNYPIKPDDLIGIMLDRSEKMIIAILAVMKSGGAYVPIDPEYPQARREFIINDTGIGVLITQMDYLFDFQTYQGALFAMDVQLDGLPDPVEWQRTALRPDNLAYLMYTSGSTGLPKGVMIEHKSAVRLVKPADYVHLTGKEVLLSTGAISFDATTFEYWSMLLHGGTLILCRKEALLDERKLAALLKENEVDTIWFTAGWLNQLIDKDLEIFSGLKTILAGGDKLSPVHINTLQLRFPDLTIINGYGPTENTTFSLAYPMGSGYGRISALNRIPVGKPINNSTAYILDRRLQLLPVGVTGEICVGGTGLSRGYLNNPELTKQKFVTHPFKTGERLYRTGDLGRWLPDGNIEFMGRSDDQVKVRGYRVELGEIENVLQENPDIETAVVIARTGQDQEKELIAYFVSSIALSASDLRASLSRILPDYMLPAFYIRLERMPLTANGKVDRKKLPDPEETELSIGIEYIAPRNETEEKLSAIWQEILGREKISVKDDFFELGGHSLKVTRVASQIHKQFDVKLDFTELFGKTVLEEQAILIERTKKTSFSAIPAAVVQPHYPLSSSQHRLWVLSQFGEGNVAYNIPGTYLFEGALDRSSLEYSLNALMTRHEALRSVFREQEPGQVRQFILPHETIGFKIAYRDLRQQQDKVASVSTLIQADSIGAFDLSSGPLLRVGLYQLEEERWVFSYVMHHIISDGWSMGILIRELLLLYNARIRGEADPLTPLRIHYKDYACWQQEQLGGKILQEHKEYWLRQFDGELPVLSLSGDRPRPAVKRYQGGVVSRSLSPGVVQALKERCRQQGATLFMGLLAAVNALLYKYTGQQDIVTGSPIAGREHTDLEDQIGFYINTLALRLRFSAADSFDELLARSRQVCLEAYGRQAYPFDELIEDLGLRRDMSRNPLFDVVVVLQNAGLSRTGDTRLGALKVSGYEHREQVISKFDLTFNFSETDSEIGSAISSQTDSQMRSKINSELGAGGIQANIEYDSAIFDRSSIVRLAGHLEQLLQALVDAPSVALGRLTYLSAGEQRPLTAAAEAATGYPRDRTIVELFEEQAAKTPDHIAVVWGQEELTYRTLNEKANGLGHYLRSRYAIRADELIGLKLERGPAMIIAMLGVLKSGGAYVPMDPDYPAERIDYMVADSGCKVVLDAAELARAAAQNSGIAQSSDGAAYPKTNLPPVNRSGDLAYVIYTSGTTGHPKGVLIEHRQVVRLFKTEKPLFDFGPADVWTMFHSYCFDFSVWEMYGALLQGGKLILVGPATARDPEAFLELLVSQGVTVLNQTPSYFDTLSRQALERAEALPALRYVIFGGEALHPGRLGAWRQHYPAVRLINMYGITETTVHVTYKEITEREIALALSNIGKPIPTLYAYVLDRDRQLVPVGVPGELYVGGAGVARGYLNRTELTAERFITNPFKEQDPDRFKEQDRLYRSGDQVKWLENGEMEYLGRMDDQVKIRGYRIELAEIQNTLQNHPQIDSVIVIARPAKEEGMELVAYMVSADSLSTAVIRTWLSTNLPAYMLPDHYVQLDGLPLTANGKIDRKKLPDPQDGSMETGSLYTAPENEIQERLVRIWSEVLDKKEIGIHDNFFDLGGNSIKLVKMTGLINKVFDKKLSVVTAFRLPDISLLSTYFYTDDIELNKTDPDFETSMLIMEETLKLYEHDGE